MFSRCAVRDVAPLTADTLCSFEIQSVEPLLWDTSIKGTSHLRGHKQCPGKINCNLLPLLKEYLYEEDTSPWPEPGGVPLWRFHCIYCTVKPPLTDTSRRQTPLVSGHFFGPKGVHLREIRQLTILAIKVKHLILKLSGTYRDNI